MIYRNIFKIPKNNENQTNLQSNLEKKPVSDFKFKKNKLISLCSDFIIIIIILYIFAFWKIPYFLKWFWEQLGKTCFSVNGLKIIILWYTEIFLKFQKIRKISLIYTNRENKTMGIFSKIFQFNFVKERTKCVPKRNPVDFSVKCVLQQKLATFEKWKIQKKREKKKTAAWLAPQNKRI